MKKPVVATVTGIRPDFIRMSEIFRRLDQSKAVDHILIHTGQHYDKMLSEVFFEELEIRKPDYNLECGGGNHIKQLSKLLPKLINTLKEVKADLVVYLGDSNSAITAPFVKKEGFKIAHIEAGMRSGDMRMFEEINRKTCDMVADYCFVYHDDYAKNLIREGYNPQNIYVVGNTIVEPIKKMMSKIVNYVLPWHEVIIDIHRPENFLYKDRMLALFEFVMHIKNRIPIQSIKMLNFLRTTKALESYDINPEDYGIELIDLMSYKDYLTRISRCDFLISDSGTAQEEPALLYTKVLVPRDYTERPQSYQYKCSKHLPLKITHHNLWDKIIDWALDSSIVPDISWLGEGDTSQKIVEAIEMILLDEQYYTRF